MRLVVDTNLWISFLISNRLLQLDGLLIGKNRFLFSSDLLNEINTTAHKPKLKEYFSRNALEEMLLGLEPFIEIVEVKTMVNICRDPKDNFLLSLAKDGKADFILTGDKDLLDLKEYHKTKIVTITQFFENIK